MTATLPVVSLLVAGLHGLLLLAITVPIVATRRGQKIGLGHAGDTRLLQRIRVHANFIEHVPLALLMLAMLELSGADRVWIALLGGVLLLARVLHAIGLSSSPGYSFGRFWGALLTFTMIGATSLFAIVRGVLVLMA